MMLLNAKSERVIEASNKHNAEDACNELGQSKQREYFTLLIVVICTLKTVTAHKNEHTNVANSIHGFNGSAYFVGYSTVKRTSN